MANELGFGFRSIGRGLKKAGRGVGRGVGKVGKGFIKLNVALIKLQAQLALLPLKFLLRAARKIGTTLCKAPEPVLKLACAQANIDPVFIPLFCTAVRENKLGLGSVRRLLPPALKVASKMAASGAFPPIVPVLAVVKRIPYVGRFAGPAELGAYASNLRNPVLRPAVDTLEIMALADHLGLLEDADAQAMGLSSEDRAIMQGYLAAAEAETTRSWIPVLGVAGAFVLGVYLACRKPS